MVPMGRAPERRRSYAGPVDDQTRARDSDRDRVVEAIEAAFVDGQITGLDRDVRVERALTAHTLGELEAITRDLQVAAEFRLAGADADPAALYRPRTASDDEAVRRQGRRVRNVLLLGLAGLIALVGLVAGLVSVFAAPDDDRAVDTGQPITVGDDSPEAVPPEVGFTLADDDVREFLTAYQERFDTLDAYEVDFYEDWVSVQVPVRGSRARAESWAFDGDFEQRGDARAVTSGARLLDMGDIGINAMFANLRTARRTLNVEEPQSYYVLVQTWDEEPTVNLYVNNDYGESGYLMTDLRGNVIRAYPYEA